MKYDANAKFVIFGAAQYYEVAFQEIINTPNVQYCYEELSKNIDNNRLLKLAHRIHYSPRLNRIKNIPFKSFWYRYEYSSKAIKPNEIIYFIFLEFNMLSYDAVFLKYLKKKYPHSKFIFWFTNLYKSKYKLTRQNGDLDYLNDYYDLILTFNQGDAEKYGLNYFDWCYTKHNGEDQPIEWDVYFCGYDKGRIDMIVKIHEKLKKEGLKTNFNVICTDDANKIYEGEIHYFTKPLPYSSVISDIENSKCLLEVMSDLTEPGNTLRVVEAIAYHKKLLSNNPFLTQNHLYNDKQMQVFSKVEDIDVDFLKSMLDSDEFVNPDDISPKRLLEYVSDYFNKGLEKKIL